MKLLAIIVSCLAVQLFTAKRRFASRVCIWVVDNNNIKCRIIIVYNVNIGVC